MGNELTNQLSADIISKKPSVVRRTSLLYILGIILLMVLIGISAYYLGSHSNKLIPYQQELKTVDKVTTSVQTPITTSSKSPKSHIAVYNLNGGAPDLTFFRSQISTSSDYFATVDTMMDSYKTQGGMAPPRIILMKGYQVNESDQGGNINYFSSIHQTQNDCIVIWSTDGFDSIEGWNNDVVDLKGILTDHQELSIGSRKVQLYKMTRKEGDIYVALLQIGNKRETSYYFHTCNTNNKSDFISVIQSIKFRDDVTE
jgi:hypothetical protein